METSLRYRGDAKSLRIHAKEKISIDTKTHLQLQGELDTKSGAPHFFSAMIRHFYPDVSASLGVGLQYDKLGKVRYKVRGKKAFPVTTNGLISFNVKGQCDIDKEFKQWKPMGAAEFSWTIFNFQRDQDVRVKVGVELLDQLSLHVLFKHLSGGDTKLIEEKEYRRKHLAPVLGVTVSCFECWHKWWC